MERLQTLIKNGLVYCNGEFVKSNIGVVEGKIALIAEIGQNLPEADTVIDAEDMHVLPGCLDTHVHVREPGFEHKEDWSTASQAAAAGGVTLIVDMPNLKPSTNNLERIVDLKKIAGSKSYVDFNHWAGPPKNLDETKEMLAEEIIGIKVFMMKDTERSYPHMPELGILNDGHLYEIFQECAKQDAKLAVHPHNQELHDWFSKHYYRDKGLTEPKDYVQSFRYADSLVYDTAIGTMLMMARSSGVNLHVLHTNTYLSTHMVRWAYKNGVRVTSEINTPHFFITMDDVIKRGPYVLGTWTPPKDQQALWDAINEDDYPGLIGSDHAPHHIDEKEIGWKDMWKAAGGAPYVQDTLALFLNAVNEGKVSLSRVVELTSERPAKEFGFYPRKGTIRVGSDADFAIVDMNKEKILTKNEGYSKCGYSPFEGWKVKGAPVYTLVRGKVVMDHGKITGDGGYGEFVPIRK